MKSKWTLTPMCKSDRARKEAHSVVYSDGKFPRI